MLGLDLDLFQFSCCVLQMKKLEQRLNELTDVIQLLDACVLLLSRVWLFATPGSVACQTPLSMEFSRQEYWSGLPFPLPGDLLLGLLHWQVDSSVQFSSVQFSRSVVSDSLRPHESQHARPPCSQQRLKILFPLSPDTKSVTNKY